MLICCQNDLNFFSAEELIRPGIEKWWSLLDKWTRNVIYETHRGQIPSAVLQNGKDKKTCHSLKKEKKKKMNWKFKLVHVLSQWNEKSFSKNLNCDKQSWMRSQFCHQGKLSRTVRKGKNFPKLPFRERNYAAAVQINLKAFDTSCSSECAA